MRHLSHVLAVAAVLFAVTASAQRVVILEIDGDSGRLRGQIENAVRQAGSLTIVPLEDYIGASARKKLKGPSSMTGAGVARVGRALNLDAAVGGDVSNDKYNVVIFDRAGAELWSRTLKLDRGLLSADFAERLSRAIATAAETGAKAITPDRDVGDEGDSSLPVVDLSNPNPDERRIVQPDEHRDSDLDREGKRRAKDKAAPKFLRASLSGTTTWRRQCLRPGVASCAEYATKSPTPQGIIIDFTASVPYLGASLDVDLFPLAGMDNAFLKGFGVLGHFLIGASLTRIVEETPQGAGPEKPVTSTDLGWSADLAWRYFFTMGYGSPAPVGYAGLRGGFRSRTFTIDPNAGVSLPSSQRYGFAIVGADVSLPISPYFRIEASAALTFSPKPSAEQIVGYGNLSDPTGGAESSGFQVSGGFAGDIVSGLGWTARLSHTSFGDRYFGQGQKWTICDDVQCGGVAEESYTALFWGVSWAF